MKPVTVEEVMDYQKTFDPLTLDKTRMDPNFRYYWGRKDKADLHTDLARRGYEVDYCYSKSDKKAGKGKSTEMGELVLYRIPKDKYEHLVQMHNKLTDMRSGKFGAQNLKKAPGKSQEKYVRGVTEDLKEERSTEEGRPEKITDANPASDL